MQALQHHRAHLLPLQEPPAGHGTGDEMRGGRHLPTGNQRQALATVGRVALLLGRGGLHPAGRHRLHRLEQPVQATIEEEALRPVRQQVHCRHSRRFRAPPQLRRAHGGHPQQAAGRSARLSVGAQQHHHQPQGGALRHRLRS